MFSVATTLLVPVKQLEGAKSRLAASSSLDAQACVIAFLLDTLEAVHASSRIDHVIVISSDATVRRFASEVGCHLVEDGPGADLNAAITHGARNADALFGPGPRTVMMADLPALRPEDFAAAVDETRKISGPAFVADTAGTGTTFYSAPITQQLWTAFGPGSAKLHRELGATPLMAAVPSLRRDVDDASDWEAAAGLGLGRRSSGLRLS